MKIGRITLSDRASSGVYEDLSGPEIERVVRECLDPDAEFIIRLLPDEQSLIEQTLIELTDQLDCALVITTGGTGPAPRDVTPEATRAVLEKELPGFGEIMRAASFPHVPTAILSRATAGVRGTSLIINLPGQPRAIETCLQPLRPAVAKCLSLLQPQTLSAH
ncbi:MAG: molybdopterin adenylyltransferase [Verrucomicrobia bacterium 61-8]|jgi:molybdopterin adenylyltransferase|nr:molybdopterin adenylyltransferase [Verrucomicrobiota bacterium]OJV02244.1 MAG: molybdopterin adenylyltransferase [Verrucomicrobia bacterium 61-8]